MVGMMADTIERNTEALIKLDGIVGRCQLTSPTPPPPNGDTSLWTRPKITPARHANNATD